MARTRNLKPGFFQNEVLGSLPPLTRILFEGLWCWSDREGRIEDRPLRIKAQILPFDDCSVDKMLAELASGPEPFILRYSNGGCKYIQVLNFGKHQNPHVNEQASTIPAPECTVHAPELHSANTEVAPPFPVAAGLTSSSQITNHGVLATPKAPYGGEAAADLPGCLLKEWNKIPAIAGLPGVEPCTGMTATRKKKIADRSTEPLFCERWREAIQLIGTSRFCQGGGDKGWRAGMDWFLRSNTVARIIEGKYAEKNGKPSIKREDDPRGNIAAANKFLEEIENDKT